KPPNIAQGVPECFGKPVVTMLVWTSVFSPHGAAGAASARHSLRPHFLEGHRIAKPGREIAPRECEGMSSSLRGAQATKQSTCPLAAPWIASSPSPFGLRLLAIVHVH